MAKPEKEPIAGYCKSLELTNFTAFKHAKLEFIGPGINVLVGENGTGKTHVMKALYSWMLFTRGPATGLLELPTTLLRVMGVLRSDQIVRGVSEAEQCSIHFGFEGYTDKLGLPRHGGVHIESSDLRPPGAVRPVFIPAIEMISHTRNFGDTYDTYELDFDWTVRDIVRLLSIKRREPAPIYSEVLERLERDALKGDISYVDTEDRYYLNQGVLRLPMPLVAEGIRKIATLHTLLRNGSITQGTTLFWDEPETNLNPTLMDELVAALLAISRTGVQIILATHSYILLEEIADAAKEGEVRYFGFEKTDDGVTVSHTSNLAELSPNPILRQYESLYNRMMAKALAKVPKK